MTNSLHPGASTRCGFPSGLCSLCKRDDIQMLYTVANFIKSKASKIRRINILPSLRKKSLQRFVCNALPPILKAYASPDCPYPGKKKGLINKRVEPDHRIPLKENLDLPTAKLDGYAYASAVVCNPILLNKPP